MAVTIESDAEVVCTSAPSIEHVEESSVLFHHHPLYSPPARFTPSPHPLPDATSLSSSGGNERGVLRETPLPPIGHVDATKPHPLPFVGSINEGMNSDLSEAPFHIQFLHKKVSFQNLDQEEEELRAAKPRPLPPIDRDVYPDDAFGAKSRRLPPLTHAQSDMLSLRSGSSQSQLFSQSGSTYSLPLPDPRYSNAPRPRTPLSLGGLDETHRSQNSRKDGKNRVEKMAARRSSPLGCPPPHLNLGTVNAEEPEPSVNCTAQSANPTS